jgi:major type 1 subunit fimbrin (pilin)
MKQQSSLSLDVDLSSRSLFTKRTTLLLICLFFFSWFGMNRVVLAQCVITRPYADSAFTLPSTITVPRNAAVGTVLQNVAAPGWNGQSTVGTCPGGTVYTLVALPGTWTPTSLANVYATNVPGIGIKAIVYANSAPVPPLPAVYGWTSGGAINNFWASFGYQLIVTGPVSPGLLSFSNPVASGWASYSSNALVEAVVFTNLVINGTSSVVVQSCVTPDVAINMGTHRNTEFNGVGSSTSSVSFNIALNGCPVGLKSIQYQIDPTTAIVQGTGNSVVTLNGSATAQGIGLQLLDGNGNPFVLSTPVTFSGYNSSTGGSYTIPLRARYYQTDATIGSGSANTAMTFTMTYQ